MYRHFIVLYSTLVFVREGEVYMATRYQGLNWISSNRSLQKTIAISCLFSWY